MEKAIQLIKSELKEFSSSVQAITGFFIIVTGLSASVVKAFESWPSIALTLVGLFIVVHKITGNIIHSKNDSFGVVRPKYTARSISVAKMIRILNWGLLLAPIYITVNALWNVKSECSGESNHLGVMISSFAPTDNDDFSYKLYISVAAELEQADTISVFRTNKMVAIGGMNYLDSLKTIFEGSCFNHGLFVFGRRSVQSNLFDCSVYINNMKVVNLDSNSKSSKNIIYLQNPDLINFSIENQSKVVSKFIVGLLQYHSGHFAEAREVMKRSIDSVSNIENIRFKSYCLLFLGNSFFKEQKYTDAIEAFRVGLIDDSANAFLHYNLATSTLMIGDSLSAYREFTFAAKLNSKLNNPLAGMLVTGGQIAMRQKSSPPETDTTNELDSEIEDTMSKVISKDGSEPKIKDTTPLYSIFQCSGKYGLYTPKGDTIIKCQYDQIFFNGIIYKGVRYFIVRSGSKYGAFDEKGVLAVPINWPAVYYVEEYITATR